MRVMTTFRAIPYKGHQLAVIIRRAGMLLSPHLINVYGKGIFFILNYEQFKAGFLADDLLAIAASGDNSNSMSLTRAGNGSAGKAFHTSLWISASWIPASRRG
jgi:hypothetical protein